MGLSARFSFTPVFAALAWGQLPNVAPASGPNPLTLPTVSPTASVVAGRFVVEEGSTLPAPVRVELDCNSIGRPMGWSDAKGDFSVRLSINNPDEVADLSYGEADIARRCRARSAQGIRCRSTRFRGIS